MTRILIAASAFALIAAPAHATVYTVSEVVQDINFLEWLADGVWCPEEGPLPLEPYIPPTVGEWPPVTEFEPPRPIAVAETPTWAMLGLGFAWFATWFFWPGPAERRRL